MVGPFLTVSYSLKIRVRQMLGLITPMKHVITLLSVIDQPWPDKCLSEACLLETLTSKIMHWASRFRPKTNSFSFESNSSNGCLSLLDIFPILITAALEDSILSFHRFFNFIWSFSFCRQQIFENFRFVLILFRKIRARAKRKIWIGNAQPFYKFHNSS